MLPMSARVAPAAMIFVPCRDGISHDEAEISSKEQCAAGAQVLLQAVLDYDRQLAERGVKSSPRRTDGEEIAAAAGDWGNANQACWLRRGAFDHAIICNGP